MKDVFEGGLSVLDPRAWGFCVMRVIRYSLRDELKI